MSEHDPGCQIYVISPPAIADIDGFASSLSMALETGLVACFQLRLKGCDSAHSRAVAAVLMPLCHAHDVAFLVNDDAALAADIGADGVHLGQQDGDVADARKLLGHSASIGVTCHDSMDLAFAAGEAGADYVAFGAFFPTTTKTVDYKAEPDLLSQWAEIAELPCVAIGGVTADNAAGLAEAGADFVAVSGYVWAHKDGAAAAVKALNAAVNPS